MVMMPLDINNSGDEQKNIQIENSTTDLTIYCYYSNWEENLIKEKDGGAREVFNQYLNIRLIYIMSILTQVIQNISNKNCYDEEFQQLLIEWMDTECQWYYLRRNRSCNLFRKIN